jgi:endoribonuclease Nob1
VLDTSAFLSGFDPLSVDDDQFTVPSVEEEIGKNSIAWVRFKTAVDNGKLKIRPPAEEYWSKAKASAKMVGDAFFLSETDTQLLALALELKSSGFNPLIITDDYSIQNVATQIEIQFASLATYGIRRLLEWIRYCPACRKRYPADYNSTKCTVCDTDLKRKPRRL